jgi:hypothetical protein
MLSSCRRVTSLVCVMSFTQLAPLLLLSCAAQLIAVVASAQRPHVVVGPTIAVSRLQPLRDHLEFLVAQDPADVKRFVACIMLWSTAKQRLSSGVYTSLDGALSWRLAYEDTTSRRVADPACAFARGGEMLFTAVTFGDFSREADSIRIYRSTDSGNSWRQTTSLMWDHRPYFAVDRTRGPYSGRIYVYTTDGGHENASEGTRLSSNPRLYYSTDSGATFSGPVAPVTSGETRPANAVDFANPGQGTVLADGTLIVPYWIARRNVNAPARPTGEHWLKVFGTTDGGSHLALRGSITFEACEDTAIPAIAVDRSSSPFRGRVYMMWAEKRLDRCRIVVANSTDGGAHWSIPVIVDDTHGRLLPTKRAEERSQQLVGKGPDAFMPSLSVNSRGVIGVSWLDRREDAGNRSYRIRFAPSLDGGETFHQSVPVSSASWSFDGPTRVAWIGVSGGGQRRSKHTNSVIHTDVSCQRLCPAVGDTHGMTSEEETFHAFWIDNRSGAAQFYTAAVTVAGDVAQYGAAANASLQDVTQNIEVVYVGAAVDNRRISLETLLVNTSSDTVFGPLKLRATALRSDQGSVRALNADNDQVGPGATWDFTGALAPGQMLVPGASTKARQLVFQVDYVQRFGHSLVDFDAKILGSLRRTSRQ